MIAKFCVSVFITKPFLEIYSAMKMSPHAISLVVPKLKILKISV